jgi:hypothetical protein
MGAGLIGVVWCAMGAVLLLGSIGEAICRPLCRRLFGRPAIATASTAFIAVTTTAVVTRLNLVVMGTALLIWSWGWALGGSLTGEWRRTDAIKHRTTSQ